MIATPRLGLPFISPGQASKELIHNEGLQLLDMIVAGAVEDEPQTSPPESPLEGTCYIIAVGAGGDWAGKDAKIATFSSGGWRYLSPLEGMSLYVRSTGVWALHRSDAWELGLLRASSLLIDGQKVVGGRASAIANPAGGSTVDAEARSAIAQILTAMRGHGLIEM